MISQLNKIFQQSSLYNKLAKNNIKTIKELLLTKPKKYENFILSDITKVVHKEEINLNGIIVDKPIFQRNKSNKAIQIHFQIAITKNIVIKVVFFNQLFCKFLKKNQTVFVKGRYNLFQNIVIASFVSLGINIMNNIKPIYKLKNITDESITNLLKNFFEYPQFKIKENLNEKILQKYRLISRQEAFKNLHLPVDQKQLNQAFIRFKYEEAFKINQKWLEERNKSSYKIPLKCDIHYVKKMIKKIPFQLTLNQKKIVNDIYKDFQKNYPTKRLIQGDVGSGKTITVFIAALAIINLNKQVLMMAPTEILAQQHYNNFKKIFPEIASICLTSKSKQKNILKKEIKENNFQMIFGTHVLSNIEFQQLGLVIIDETHKFGIDIQQKTISQNIKSDVLYLTATPIPQTLANIYLGFLNISLLTEKPYDKQKIITRKCSFSQVTAILQQNQLRNEQTYIVVPAIQDDTKYFNIQKITSFLQQKKVENLYILHGKIKTKQQEEEMYNFNHNPKGILLTTSIIEVGIDNPNTTTIIILGAEYFGLSQLHQLRGRVGRNTKKNYCFLVYQKDNERLKILERENNGFKLSEFDLKNRGPGEILGKKQSGFLKYNFLNFLTDFKIISQVQKDLENFYNKSSIYSL